MRSSVTRSRLFELAGLLVGGCAHKYRPIYNVDRPMSPNVQRLSPDRTRDTIARAGRQLDWDMKPAAPGHFVATHEDRKHSATVDVYYTPAKLQIILKSTQMLNQTATTIHDHYNLWVRHLEKRIVDDLELVAAK